MLNLVAPDSRGLLHALKCMSSWHAHIITLEDAYDRRKKISAHLNSLSMGFTYVSATPANRLPFIESETPLTNKHAQLACLSSHLLLLRRLALKGRAKAYLVLEDDCVLHPEFALAIRHFAKYIPENSEILQLGASNPHVLGDHIMHYHSGFACTRWYPDFWGTYGYIISHRAAKRIASRFVTMQEGLDLKGWHMPGQAVSDMLLYSSAVTYTLTYPLAIPGTIESSIGYYEIDPNYDRVISSAVDIATDLWNSISPFGELKKLGPAR